MDKIWYSFFSFKNYVGPEPSFWDASQFSWTALLEENHAVIREELDQYLLKEYNLTPYYNIHYVNKIGAWKTISMLFWNVSFRDIQSKFPHTISIIKKIPGCVTASFSMLDAHGVIKAHHGDTNAIIKAHLGLYIPEGLPNVGFRVREEKQAWQESKVFVFTDAYNHEAWNQSEQQRWILLIDVVQEKYLSKTKCICIKNIAFNAVEGVLAKLGIFGRIISIMRPLWVFMALPFAAWFYARRKIAD